MTVQTILACNFSGWCNHWRFGAANWLNISKSTIDKTNSMSINALNVSSTIFCHKKSFDKISLNLSSDFLTDINTLIRKCIWIHFTCFQIKLLSLAYISNSLYNLSSYRKSHRKQLLFAVIPLVLLGKSVIQFQLKFLGLKLG